VSIVRIRECVDGFDVELDVTGTDGVPLAIEIGCPTDSEIEGAVAVADDPARWLTTTDQTRVSAGTDHIDLDVGRAEHGWTQLRGALPKLPGKSVYATGLTPFRRTLHFRR